MPTHDRGNTDIRKTVPHKSSAAAGPKGLDLKNTAASVSQHTPDAIMQLQKTIGNRNVTQLLRASMHAGTPLSPPIQRKENGTGMPDRLKNGLEDLSGMDLSDVRVHYNSSKPEEVQASAYAQGNDIHIGPGQEKHLPHEGWHVVQQRQQRVQPTLQMSGMLVNDDKDLEREADIMGAAAYKSNHDTDTSFSADTGAQQPGQAIQRAGIIQRKLNQKMKKALDAIKGDLIVGVGLNGDDKKTNYRTIKAALNKLNHSGTPANVADGAEYLNCEIESDEAPKEEVEGEYPFPNNVPATLYRWVSRSDGKNALANGITKYGGIHDGIPTMPNKITKEKAGSGGGGVGIVSADMCLEIDTSMIPEIANREVNAIKGMRQQGGYEWKILVTIPAAAISKG